MRLMVYFTEEIWYRLRSVRYDGTNICVTMSQECESGVHEYRGEILSDSRDTIRGYGTGVGNNVEKTWNRTKDWGTPRQRQRERKGVGSTK